MENNLQRVKPFKIGLAVPCYTEDIPYLAGLSLSIARLNPYPDKVKIEVNQGPLKTVREHLFDELFQTCDVVLSADADFYLFPHILRYIRRNQAVSFADLKTRVSDLPISLIRLVWPHSWSGLYSLPRETWFNQIKPFWDGTDGSIKQLLNGNYHFVKRFSYYDRRPYARASVHACMQQRSFFKKMAYRFLRLQT